MTFSCFCGLFPGTSQQKSDSEFRFVYNKALAQMKSQPGNSINNKIDLLTALVTLMLIYTVSSEEE